MAKKRATGRFYFLLILLLSVTAYFVYQLIPQKASEATVRIAMSSDERQVDVVIVRNELIASYDGLERVEYTAAEGQQVAAGEEIANIYTTSYIAKELSKLESTHDSIRAYQQTIFADISDSALERLNDQVQSKALELKSLVTGRSTGNMSNMERSLNAAMQARRNYLAQYRMEDTKLIQLYQEEDKRESSISSWRTSAQAERSGIVSFYFDGYEEVLSGEDFSSIPAELLRKVAAGDSSVQTQKSVRSEQVYRIVSTQEWYVALLSRDTDWNPVTGQQLSFQLDGFTDLMYTGTVIGVQRSGGDIIIQLSVTDPIGPLLYQRSGKAKVGIYTSGLAVPVSALYYQAGQPGVWVTGSYGVSFVPVDILSQDRSFAIIQPMQSDALYEGQTVMIY